jgi:hypothetical protein
MKYALLIAGDEKAAEAAPPEARDAMMQAFMDYGKEIEAAGVVRGMERLAPSSTATTVSGRTGSTVTTDGPFAETKEQLGGLFVIECADLDEAISWASKIPSISAGGTVEVRPILEM